jgi:DNA-binding XRE family transcriptional regulator
MDNVDTTAGGKKRERETESDDESWRLCILHSCYFFYNLSTSHLFHLRREREREREREIEINI